MHTWQNVIAIVKLSKECESFCISQSFGRYIVYRRLKDKRDSQDTTFTPDQLRNLGTDLLSLCYALASQNCGSSKIVFCKVRDKVIQAKRSTLAQKRQGKELSYQDIPGMTNQVYSNGEEE